MLCVCTALVCFPFLMVSDLVFFSNIVMFVCASLSGKRAPMLSKKRRIYHAIAVDFGARSQKRGKLGQVQYTYIIFFLLAKLRRIYGFCFVSAAFHLLNKEPPVLLHIMMMMMMVLKGLNEY